MINDFYRNYFSATINSNLNGLQYAISSKRGTYTFSNCSAEDMEKVMSILPYEYPMTYSVFLNETNGLSNGTVNFRHVECEDDLFYEKLNKIQEDLQKRISYNNSQSEIAKIIYDYLTSNYIYDHDALREFGKTDIDVHQNLIEYNNQYGSSFNIYGVVMNKKGVCAGLCQFYRYLLNCFGLEAICVVGFFKQNGNVTNQGHSVVVVEIDGEYCYVDVAAGVKNCSNLNITFYNKFLVSNDEMYKSFEPLYPEYQYINCVDKYSYYNTNKVSFDTIEKLTIYLNSMINQKKENRIYCRYIGSAIGDEKLKKLVQDIVGTKKGCQNLFNFVVKDGFITIKIYQEKRGKRNER